MPDLTSVDEPKEFKNVKDVPAIFTINKFNFTEDTLEECSCDRPNINIKEKSLITLCNILTFNVIFYEYMYLNNLS